MKWFYTLMVFSAGSFCIGTLLGFSGLFIQQDKMDANLFTGAAGFLLATAGWLLTSGVNLRIRIRDQTIRYLEHAAQRMNHSGELNRLWVVHNVDEKIKCGEAEHFFRTNALTHPVFLSIRNIANFYEEMGVAIKTGAVEDRTLRKQFATNIRWFWARIFPFIHLYRNDPPIEGHPHGPEQNIKVFSHCEELAKRWAGKEE